MFMDTFTVGYEFLHVVEDILPIYGFYGYECTLAGVSPTFIVTLDPTFKVIWSNPQNRSFCNSADIFLSILDTELIYMLFIHTCV